MERVHFRKALLHKHLYDLINQDRFYFSNDYMIHPQLGTNSQAVLTSQSIYFNFLLPPPTPTPGLLSKPDTLTKGSKVLKKFPEKTQPLLLGF